MNDYSMLAFTVFTGLVVVVTGQIALDTAYWTIFSVVVIVGSLVFYFAMVIILYEGGRVYVRATSLCHHRNHERKV
jgi:phospholipid-translocating ATPase